MQYIRASEARAGLRVSYTGYYGEVGAGYLKDGKVYKSCGNGLYQERPVRKYYVDNGQRYIDKVSGLGIFPGHRIK